MANKIAVVRVRGHAKLRKQIRDTLDMLRLHDKNYCVFLTNTPNNAGMVNKVKDFVTFGEVDEEIVKEMVSKRGAEFTGREEDSKGKIKYSRKYFEMDGKKYKKFFRLAPPVKGFGGIKKPFSKGGALGDRKEKISELLKRMM